MTAGRAEVNKGPLAKATATRVRNAIFNGDVI